MSLGARLVELAISAAVLLLVVIALFWLRKLWLSRTAGVFECGLRRRAMPDGDATGWALGFARYDGDQVVWFRAFSLSPTPSYRLPRAEVEVLGSRVATEEELWAVPHGAMVLRCADASGRVVELGMTAATLTGFQAWLEAAPPGRHLEGI